MKKILIYICLCVGIVGKAQSESTDSVIDRIKEANLRYSSITSNFTQVRHLSFVAQDAVTTGKFFYRKPDYLLMRYEQPTGDLTLINNDHLVIIAAGKYSKASTKTSSRARTMKTILASCLQGDVSLIDGVTLSSEESADAWLVTANLKKKTKTGVHQVVLAYDKSDMTLRTMRMNESDGSYTLYTLTDKTLNESIGDEVFKIPSKK
jgi:outer membrane lipoprotein-sorting protein